MRLTLRTMLCYLDDVLEPEDAKELGAKIEESEYASNVVHRIRTSMRRLRLGAPALSGKQMGLDPNTVADYLDNTLPAEQVPDFERVCLDMESEVHLAEVAACHQILTLVLGEPAEVSPAMRERMVAIGQGESSLAEDADAAAAVSSGIAGEAVSAAGASAASSDQSPAADIQQAPAALEPARTARPKPQVPEYLRMGKGRSWGPMLLTVLFLLLLGGGALWSTGALDVLFNMNRGGTIAARPDSGAPPSPDDGLFAVPRGDGTAADLPAVVDGVKDAVEDMSPPADGAPAASNGRNGAREGDEVAPPNIASPPDSAKPPADSAASRARDEIAPPAAEGGDRLSALPAGVDDAAADAGPPLPLVDKVMGHYSSAGQVMAFYDEPSSAWMRMPQRAAVKPGLRLKALPTYRPQIFLENKIQITFVGESAAEVANPVEDRPHLVLHTGRAIIAAMGGAGNELMLRAGDRDVLLTMANADAEVAVEVGRFHSPGDDPETVRSHVRTVATVVGGQVEWQQAGAEPVTLDVGQALSFEDEGIAAVASDAEVPRWVKSHDASEIDRLASAALEPLLDEERPLQVVLEEQAGHTRVEVRSLAARSLASLGHFDRIVDSLGDDSLKSYWKLHFNHLQQLLAGDRKAAELLSASLVRRKGEAAPRIYRLLWGYSPRQLADGADKALVEYLKHDSLDVRVLAIHNLERITGKTHGYLAHFPEARRRTAQRDWEQRATDGSIVYAAPPRELPPREE